MAPTPSGPASPSNQAPTSRPRRIGSGFAIVTVPLAVLVVGLIVFGAWLGVLQYIVEDRDQVVGNWADNAGRGLGWVAGLVAASLGFGALGWMFGRAFCRRIGRVVWFVGRVRRPRTVRRFIAVHKVFGSTIGRAGYALVFGGTKQSTLTIDRLTARTLGVAGRDRATNKHRKQHWEERLGWRTRIIWAVALGTGSLIVLATGFSPAAVSGVPAWLIAAVVLFGYVATKGDRPVAGPFERSPGLGRLRPQPRRRRAMPADADRENDRPLS